MTGCIEYKQAFFRDGLWPQTLEDAIRLSASYAGVHKFDFQDTIDEGFADLDDWTADALGSWLASAGQLTITADAGDLWYQIRHDVEVPLSFVASFDLVSGTGGFLFRGKDGSVPNEGYVAWWSASTCGFDRVDASRNRTTLISVPVGVTPPARIQVHVRYSLDSVDDDRKWMEGALFVDGQCYVGFADDIGGTAYDWDGDYIGFTIKNAEQMVVDNLSVSSLTRAVEWVTIDPGTPPASGMSRAMGTTRLIYQCRHDGTLRVWRPGDRDLDWTVESGRAIRKDERRSVLPATHVRVQAAIHEADAFDDEEGEARMHRFILHNDPNLMTEREAYDEGVRVLHDQQERGLTVRFIVPPNFLLEPNDRVSLDGTDYRVISVGTSMTMTGEGPQIAQTVEAQKYIAL